MTPNYRIPNYYSTTPPVPLVRVYAKNPGEPLAVFEAMPPIRAAIEQVKRAGYAKAMVVVK